MPLCTMITLLSSSNSHAQLTCMTETSWNGKDLSVQRQEQGCSGAPRSALLQLAMRQDGRVA